MFFFNFELFLNFELFISFFGTENHENLTESYLKFWQIWKNKIVGPEKGSKFFSEINKKRRLDQNYFKNLRILEIFSKNKNPWKVVRHFKEKVEGGRYDIQGKFFISYCDELYNIRQKPPKKSTCLIWWLFWAIKINHLSVLNIKQKLILFNLHAVGLHNFRNSQNLIL